MKKIYLGVIVIAVLLALYYNNTNAKQIAKVSSNSTMALTLMKNNCFSCHNPDLNCDNRVAPPMFKVRNHYFDDKISKDAFIKNIVNFVNNPTEANSIMPGAVANFGLMPKQTFKEEDLKLIAEYIYENDLESDAWYAKWDSFNKNVDSKINNLSVEDMGLNYINSTKSELGKNLLNAIKEKGSAGAVSFCNTKATWLTDSMAKFHNISIRRVTDKPRNANNTANEAELNYIKILKELIKKGIKPKPNITEQQDKVIGYYPIETNKMCLQCHGNTEDINKETVAAIKKSYPTDKAIGYGENQIRGIWVVEFKK